MPPTIRLYRIPFDGPGHIPPPEVAGNKAHNLMRIAGRIPVPPAFVIPVAFCRQYETMGDEAVSLLHGQIEEELEWLGRSLGKQFNSKRSPLLVSIRSGAPVSMPGMMKTVLNIGLNEETAKGLLRQTGNPKFVWDCLRRFIQQYGEVVHDLSSQPFEQIYADLAPNQDVQGTGPDTETLRAIVSAYLQHFSMAANSPFPESPKAQLHSAIAAVLRSWHSKRAAAYRKIHNIPGQMGTAVIVQAMVFGNTGRRSGSGVGFTRNPANGKKEPYIDYLADAQGEDVVSGRKNVVDSETLARDLPEIHSQLMQACQWLEQEFRDMQEFEFTVEQGRLYLLQSRSGKRTGQAALKIATDLVEEQIIKPASALKLLNGFSMDDFSAAALAPAGGETPIARAISGGSGVAAGIAVFDLEKIDSFLKRKKPVIYVGRLLSTDDIEIMTKVRGLVTVLGARTSHATVVARQLGKICIVGCQTLTIDEDRQHCHFGETRVEEGDWLTLDGNTGHIYLGQIEQVSARPQELLERIAAWKRK